jgi:hypothetical protein
MSLVQEPSWSLPISTVWPRLTIHSLAMSWLTWSQRSLLHSMYYFRSLLVAVSW